MPLTAADRTSGAVWKPSERKSFPLVYSCCNSDVAGFDSDVAQIFFKEGAVSQMFRTDHDYFSTDTIQAFKDLWDALNAINEDEHQKVATVTTSIRTFAVTDPPKTLFDIWISFPNGKTVHISWFSTSGASIEQQLFPRP